MRFMKKSVVLLLVLCLMCGTAGCGPQAGKLDSLGVAYEDGRTVTMDMDMAAVRQVMGSNYENAPGIDSYQFDRWREGALFVDYKVDQVSDIYVAGEAQPWSTTLGVSYGDSLAAVKERLGEPMRDQRDSEYPDGDAFLYYAFYQAGEHYEQVENTYDSWEAFNAETKKSPDRDNYYMLALSMARDKVYSCSISRFTR